MTRVWLTDWEWHCCGTPFAVCDEVALATTPAPDEWLERMLGAELAGTIDAVESHHDEPGPEQIVGRVTAIHAVTIEMRNRRIRRDPRTPSPMTSKLTLTADDGRPLAWVAGPPTEWFVQGTQLPGTGRLRTAERVPSPPGTERPGRADRVAAALRGEGPQDWSDRSLVGWVVDLDTGLPARP